MRPITKLFGTWEVPIYPEEKKLSIDSKAIIIFPPSLEFEEEGGTQSAIVYGGIGGDMECETEQAWIHPTMIQPTATLSVEVDPNGTNQYRQGKIVVREKISDLEEMTDTLIVKQYGGSSDFAGQSIMFSTICSAVTIPLFLYLISLWG